VRFQFFARSAALAAVVVFLAACESSEERAEKYYQSGLELLEAGDVDRAIIEFRNAFQLDRAHLDSRKALAGLMLSEGNNRGAYRQYLVVSEISPEDTETRLVLAELAAVDRNWEEVERHYAAVQEAGLDTTRTQAIGVILEYRDALLAQDTAAREAAEASASELLVQLPENRLLHGIVIESLARNQRWTAALDQIDMALAVDREIREFHDMKLQVLAALEDADGIEAQLIEMIELYPGDTNVEAALLRLYLAQGRVEDAETYLRTRAEASNDITPKIELIEFIVRTQGTEAGLAAIETELAANPADLSLQSLRASLLFDSGDADGAISSLEAAIAGADETTDTSTAKITLTRIFRATGNEVGARRLVEEILAEDANNVEALKMSAVWLIEADRPDEAIQSLRVAMDGDPNDPETMTLLANAHERAGNRQLSREMLSLAVEASNNAPEESLRYARLLANEDSMLAAEDILISSLRLNENNVQLLGALGDLYVATEDWPRAQQVIENLRRLDTEETNAVADRLQVSVLAGQDRTDETVAFLEQLAEGGDQAVGAQIALSRAQLVAGNEEEAIRLIEEAIDASPDVLALKFAGGAIYSAVGDFAAAEQSFKEILDQNSNAERVWIELMRVQNAQGKRDEAVATLEEALTVLPNAPNLMWAQASIYEQNGDFEDAIAVYEEMYAANSNAPVIANNLASLISTYRTDEASLERAYAVARRLRGIDFPAFQDTFGWIAFRRGELDEALEHLEPAAAGLPDDALVQYHLARTYEALGRTEEALEQFRRTVSIAGDADLRPQIADAKQRIVALENPQPAE